jgi:hypothetical protein
MSKKRVFPPLSFPSLCFLRVGVCLCVFRQRLMSSSTLTRPPRAADQKHSVRHDMDGSSSTTTTVLNLPNHKHHCLESASVLNLPQLACISWMQMWFGQAVCVMLMLAIRQVARTGGRQDTRWREHILTCPVEERAQTHEESTNSRRHLKRRNWRGHLTIRRHLPSGHIQRHRCIEYKKEEKTKLGPVEMRANGRSRKKYFSVVCVLRWYVRRASGTLFHFKQRGNAFTIPFYTNSTSTV